MDFYSGICYNTDMTDYLAGIRGGETGEKFSAFYALLSEYNQKVNLTRITGREE